MAILVTRSGPAGRNFAQRLAADGYAVAHYAPVEPGPPAAPATVRRQLLDALPIDILIAPSAQSLRQLSQLLTLDQLGAPVVVVPGPGSAKVAADLGFGRIVFPTLEGRSERILELPELADVAGARVVIAAAAGGRSLIQQRLRAQGARVRRLEVYRRVAVPPTPDILQALSDQQSWVTLLASGGALSALRQQLPQQCWLRLVSQAMIAPSARVAQQAEAAGCNAVITASGADDDSMLTALGRVGPRYSAVRYPLSDHS